MLIWLVDVENGKEYRKMTTRAGLSMVSKMWTERDEARRSLFNLDRADYGLLGFTVRIFASLTLSIPKNGLL